MIVVETYNRKPTVKHSVTFGEIDKDGLIKFINITII